MILNLVTRGILKKIFTLFIYPTSLFTIVGILFIYLLVKGKLKKWHKIAFVTFFVIILIATSQPVSSLFIYSLENDYASLTDSTKIQQAEYIIVLGSGYTKGNNLPELTQLSNSSLARLMEGTRLKKINPNATLIFSGGNNANNKENKNEAEIYQIAYQSISNDTSKQILSKLPHNTKSEATEIYKLIGNKPAILVTAACHMPRAMYLFQKQGCNVTAAPCEFLAKDIKYFPDLPNSYSIKQFEMAIHEFIGITAYKLID